MVTSLEMAELIADALKDAGIINGSFDQAISIIEEEINVRMLMGGIVIKENI